MVFVWRSSEAMGPRTTQKLCFLGSASLFQCPIIKTWPTYLMEEPARQILTWLLMNSKTVNYRHRCFVFCIRIESIFISYDTSHVIVFMLKSIISIEWWCVLLRVTQAIFIRTPQICQILCSLWTIGVSPREHRQHIRSPPPPNPFLPNLSSNIYGTMVCFL